MEKIDRGAHFYRCDFQVHTPRDLSWKGNSYVSDEERKDYAKKAKPASLDAGRSFLWIFMISNKICGGLK